MVMKKRFLENSEKTNVDMPLVAVLWKSLLQPINLIIIIAPGFGQSIFLVTSFLKSSASTWHKIWREIPEKRGPSSHAKYLKVKEYKPMFFDLGWVFVFFLFFFFEFEQDFGKMFSLYFLLKQSQWKITLTAWQSQIKKKEKGNITSNAAYVFTTGETFSISCM